MVDSCIWISSATSRKNQGPEKLNPFIQEISLKLHDALRHLINRPLALMDASESATGRPELLLDILSISLESPAGFPSACFGRRGSLSASGSLRRSDRPRSPLPVCKYKHQVQFLESLHPRRPFPGLGSNLEMRERPPVNLVHGNPQSFSDRPDDSDSSTGEVF